TPSPLKQKIAIPNAGNHVIGSAITSKDILGVEHAMDGFIAQRLNKRY
ncbi:MAG: alpha/beta hydrolase, partial [Flavobacterium sp.]